MLEENLRLSLTHFSQHNDVVGVCVILVWNVVVVESLDVKILLVDL